jgi:tetratricopeptide (TPR) repeat protein
MPAATRIPASALLALAALLTTAAPVGAQTDDPRRAYLAGNGFLTRGMDALAVEEYRRFLKASPAHEDTPTARYGLGVALQRLGKNEEAIEALDGLVDIRGFRFADETRIVNANAQFTLGRYAEAVRQLEPLIDQAPQSIVEAAAPLLMESLHRTADDAHAVEVAERIIGSYRITSLGQRGALFAALCAERVEDHARAGSWARSAAGLAGDEQLASLAQLCIARVSLHGGDTEGAIRISGQVAQHGPDGTRLEALTIQAESLRRAGRIEEADRVYATIQSESPDSNDGGGILIQRGVIAFEEGRYEQALRFFTQGDDGGEDTARWSARCERRLGNAAQAAIRLEKIEQPSPGALYELGVALRESGRLDDASASFERYLRSPEPLRSQESDALRAHAAYALASIDHAQQRYRGAAERCRAILEASDATDNATSKQIRSGARLLLAECLYLDGDLVGARSAYKACLDAGPSEASKPAIAYRLGMIQARLGDKAAAETILRSVTRGATTAPEFAPGLRTLGELAMDRQDWDAAVDAFTQYLAITNETDDPTRMKLGIALARTDRNARALDSLDAAIAGNLDRGSLARAHFERGDTRQAIGDSDGAAEDWRRSIQLDDDGAIRTAAGLRLSNNALAGGDERAARRQLRAVIDDAHDSESRSMATLDLGRLELQSGESESAARTLGSIEINDLPVDRRGEALACLSIACARSGDDRGAADADERLGASGPTVDRGLLAPLLYERAWRYRRGDDPKAAIEAYQRLLDLNPDGGVASNAALELSDLLLEAGETSEAIALLRGVTSTASIDEATTAEASIRLGTLLYNSGDFASAIDALQGVLDRADPDDRSLDQPRLLCGESLHRLGLWALAVSQFEVAARSGTGSIAEPALLRLGSDAAELQRWSISEAAYEEHLSRFPSSEHRLASRFGIGWARESSGNPGSAIEAYREASQGHTQTAARAQFQLGECLFALGRHEEAAIELVKVDILYASPEWSAAALYEAGRCFDALGDHERATEQWRRVIGTQGAGEWATMARARLGERSAPAVAGDADTADDPGNHD